MRATTSSNLPKPVDKSTYEAVSALAGRLSYGGSEDRISAAIALGETGEARAVAPLIRALIKETAEWRRGDLAVRSSIIEALTRLGPVAEEPLIEIIEASNADLHTRAIAIGALCRVKDQRSELFVDALIVEIERRLAMGRDIRACLRSSEQQPEECQVDHLQAGIQLAFAVLP
jgi:hypothetical protein